MQGFENILLWNLMTAVIILGQARPNMKLNSPSSSGLRSDCVGNQMRLSLDKALALGNQLEVEAINGSQHIVLTPSLAAQCGYSMESDPWGNTRIYTSLMACYVDNKEDTTFNIGLRLKMYSQRPSDIVSHNVMQTCSYTRWASREILCDRNYMEVSNYMALPDAQAEAKGQSWEDNSKNVTPDVSGAAHGIWKLTFYTPEPVSMVLREAEQAGYGAMSTSNRLVMRSPYNTAETYSEDVAGVPMEVFRVSVYYKAPQGLSVVNLAAACPTGGVLFTEDVISWHVPRRVTPLLDDSFKIAEMHMGINGQRLDKSQMATQGYTLATTDFHIVLEIPVGSPDGYYKSHAPDYQYHITYTVEPMLEVLWRADNTQENTRYKILFPITTPLMPRPPHIQDDTVSEDRVFSVHLGTFLHDVELKNITFSTEVLTVEECSARGFTVQEQRLPSGTKSFSLQVPFDADVVLTQHNFEHLVTAYFLHLIFGFIILPEETPFAHPVELQAFLQDVVPPKITGTCDENWFYIDVKYGSPSINFKITVGLRELTPELAEGYNFQENSTHFSLTVPYNAMDSAFELITSDSVRARLDLILSDPINNWVVADLYLACSFPLMTTKCYSNGTMTALAVKVESVPNLIPNLLTLKDKSCKPVFSDERFAYFSFSVDSCGTTRTFFDHYMLYENEIGLDYNDGAAYKSTDPDYRQTISCYYVVNDTQTVAFSYKPRSVEPTAEIGSGQLVVQMQLAQDSLYEVFYQAEDYPVVQYLRQPLYFEVELMHSADPQLELILENCWATLHEDRTSMPSWDIIVDGCENLDDSYVTMFHPVQSDTRVAIPSHVKRFSVKMFTFTKDKEVLKDEIYVHCDAVICDTNSQADPACRGQCVHPTDMSIARNQDIKGGIKRGQSISDSTHQRQLSSGPILQLNSLKPLNKQFS